MWVEKIHRPLFPSPAKSGLLPPGRRQKFPGRSSGLAGRAYRAPYRLCSDSVFQENPHSLTRGAANFSRPLMISHGNINSTNTRREARVFDDDTKEFLSREIHFSPAESIELWRRSLCNSRAGHAYTAKNAHLSHHGNPGKTFFFNLINAKITSVPTHLTSAVHTKIETSYTTQILVSLFLDC